MTSSSSARELAAKLRETKRLTPTFVPVLVAHEDIDRLVRELERLADLEAELQQTREIAMEEADSADDELARALSGKQEASS